jgi:hypothetical protein
MIMLTGISNYIIITFVISVILTYLFFIAATKNKFLPSIVIFTWLAITGLLAISGFFKDSAGMPPKFTLAVAPALIFILGILTSKRGNRFINNLNLKSLTILHIVRIPVEVVLYWLAINKAVPELMTFEGRNFDIVSGVTAPVIYLICFKGEKIRNRQLLLIWNIICLGLLFNIVINAVLSAPFAIQKLAFDQPNIAVLHFPFVWLPSFIVIIVLFSHLVVIKSLLSKRID